MQAIRSVCKLLDELSNAANCSLSFRRIGSPPIRKVATPVKDLELYRQRHHCLLIVPSRSASCDGEDVEHRLQRHQCTATCCDSNARVHPVIRPRPDRLLCRCRASARILLAWRRSSCPARASPRRSPGYSGNRRTARSAASHHPACP